MPKHTIVMIIVLLSLAKANIWDNVYSQGKATMPIIIQEAFNLQFSIKQYSSKINVDFNPQLQLITLGIYFDLLLMKVEIFKAQIDLHKLIFTIKRQGTCERIKLAMFQKMQLGQANLNKQRVFLINLLFKFLGESQRGGQVLNKFSFEPFILGKNSTQFQNFTSQISKGFNKQLQDAMNDEIDQKIKEKIQNVDFFDLKIGFFVYTDKAKGNPKFITVSQKDKASKEVNVPFKLFSNVDKPQYCKTQIKTLTNEQVKNLLVKAFQSAGDFSKYLN